MEAARTTYYALVHPLLIYCLPLWGGSCHVKKILILQKKAVRAIEGFPNTTSCRPLFVKYGILTLPSLYILQILMDTREKLLSYQCISDRHRYPTRNSQNIDIPFIRLRTNDWTTQGRRLYNCLPENWKLLPNKTLKNTLKLHLQEHVCYMLEEFILSLQAL